ncbi:MAG: DUF5320 domain-containing protein [Armatimonadota bacterium]|nr:MAG: DUF5320 domain-containing protein [Armatimonadota bacterium]
MPRGDGTGPAGMGPMTGRAAGYCAGYSVPGFMNPYGGRGMGMAWGRGGGWGMGMAWRRGWGRGGSDFWPGAYAPAPYGPPTYGQPAWSAPSREDETEMLRSQADWLKGQMDAVNERIQELEKEQD